MNNRNEKSLASDSEKQELVKNGVIHFSGSSGNQAELLRWLARVERDKEQSEGKDHG